MSDTMTLEQFRQAKESGVDLYAEETQQVQEDAAPEQEVQEEQEEQPESVEETAEQEEKSEEIPEEHKSAWAKRAERERKKAREEAEAEFQRKLEETLNPYKSVLDRLGLDPQTALDYLEKQRLEQEQLRILEPEAERLQYQYGWNDQQTNEWIKEQSELRVRQAQQEQELHDLRVQVQINNLAENPDYTGIKTMKDSISKFMRDNPKMTVEQAYWAVGGPNLAQQLKREAEQREVVKRQQAKRTVLSDAPNTMKAPDALPPEAIKFARDHGYTEEQVRMMLEDKGPKDLEDYRKMKRR